jgi:hypothetical protein
LLSVNRVDDASESLPRLRGKKYPESRIRKDIDDIAGHINLERELEASGSYLDLFKGTDLRRTHALSAAFSCARSSQASLLSMRKFAR